MYIKNKNLIVNIILGLVFGFFLILIYKCVYFEGYKNKQEKASAIYHYWKTGGNKSYKDFKKNIKYSDVVEYTDTRKLMKNGDISIQKIESVIS